MIDERAAGRRFSDFDFRRPGKLGRDVLRVLELAHETFTRRLSSGWGSELRSIVQVEPLGLDQMAYDDHIRSMPNPNVVYTIAVPPLPGAIVVDCNVQLAIQMVERLLGAAPLHGVTPPRRPSEVEADLMRFLGSQCVAAIRTTLSPLVDVEPRLESVEFNPQLVQVAAPSDTTLLLSYRISVSQGLDASGFLTIAYPSPTLMPLLEHLASRRQREERTQGENALTQAAVASALADVPVALAVQLNSTSMAAADISQLRVGDVLRLDHRIDAPARGIVGGEPILTGHLGRRGRRLAVQVDRWATEGPLISLVENAAVGAQPDDVNDDRTQEHAT